MVDVSLEIPLTAFFVRWLVERDHAGGAGVQVLGKPFDRAALAGRIAPFEQHDELLAGFLRPKLHFQEFRLKLRFLCLIGLSVHFFGVRIAAIVKNGVGFGIHGLVFWHESSPIV